MPHIRVEYSQSLDDSGIFDIQGLLEQMHVTLGERGQNNITLDRVKSRAFAYPHFLIGNGTEETDFIIVTLLLMPGRSDAVKKEIAEEQLSLIQQYLGKLSSKTRITVDVQDLSSAYSYT